MDAKGNEAEFAPNCGIWNTENKFLNADNETINTVFDTYSELGVLKNDNEFTVPDLLAINMTGIDIKDFNMVRNTNKGIISCLIVAKQ